MTPCRSNLGRLVCVRDGGHAGPHRNGLTIWPQDYNLPAWLKRARLSEHGLARDLTSKGAS